MIVKRFEDLQCWRKSQDLAVQIYTLFSKHDDYGFRKQLCNAAVSISNNIAEGFDRKTDTEFKRFLYIALGSNSEVKSMLYLAERLKYLEIDKAKSLRSKCLEISMIINGLIRSLN